MDVAPIGGTNGLDFDKSGRLYFSVYAGPIYRWNPATPAVAATIFSTPGGAISGIHFDAAGNLVVGSSGTGTVVSINPAGTTVTTLATGLNYPQWVTMAPFHIYVSKYDRVDKYTDSGWLVGTQIAGLATVEGINFGPDGKLYVCELGNNRILRFLANGVPDPDLTPAGVFANVSVPIEITFDAIGRVYVSSGSNNVVRFEASGTSPITFAMPSYGLRVGPDQLLYSAHYPSSTIYRANLDGTAVSPIQSGLGWAYGIDFDSQGVMFVACELDDKVYSWDGITAPAPFSTIDAAHSLAVDRSDRVLVTNYGSLVRLLRNGAIDTTFKPVFDTAIFVAVPRGSVAAPPPPPADTTPPITVATLSPAPNAAGWNNSAVLVTLTATDAGGSGVKEISHNGLGSFIVVPGSMATVNFNGESDTSAGTALSFFAKDNASPSNVETTKTQVVKIDLTKPVPTNQLDLTTPEDTPKTGTVSGTDALSGVNPMGYSKASGPGHGTATVAADGSFTYTPNLNSTGQDTFTFTVTDNAGNTDTGTITINVMSEDDAPVANGQMVTTEEDTPISITLTATDADAGDTLTYIVVDPPTFGMLSGTAPNLTYTPNANYNGPDSFTFKANDGDTDSNIATVSITVRPADDPPIASDSIHTTPEDTVLNGMLVAMDPDGDSITYMKVLGPTHGAVTVNMDGTFTYTPNANYSGPDSFTFQASDGAELSNVATVTIDVTPVNDTPTANNQDIVLEEDSVHNGMLTASDIDGDPLTYLLVSQATHGTAVVNVNGSFTYTPNANTNGMDSFTFKVHDGLTDSNTATVSITVNPLSDPPIADPKMVSTNEDTPVTDQLTGMDPDGMPVTFEKLTNPANGTVTVNSNGQFTYTPNTNYHGTDSFTFRVSDGQDVSSPATVTIEVLSVNDAPVANDQTVTVAKDGSKEITLTASDADGDTLSYTVTSGPMNGMLFGTAPNLTYAPNAGYSGSDSFKFIANDGLADSNEATISINVSAVNNNPLALDDGLATDVNTPVLFNVLANDSDPDGDTLIVTSVGTPVSGNLVWTSDGSMFYTPKTGFNGVETFSYTISDGRGGTASANVIIVVGSGGSNHAPTASAITPVVATPAHNGSPDANPASFTLNGSASSDPDGDALSFVWREGAIVRGTAATLTLSRAPGSYTFILTVTDPFGASDTATVKVTVNPEPNQAPNADAVTGTSPLTALPGQTVKLGGGSSTDPDSDVLTHQWYEGGLLIATGKNQDVLLAGGTHEITLVVTDPYNASDTDTVMITIAKGATSMTVASLNGRRGSTANLKATLRDSALKGLAGRTIEFKLAGVIVGSAVTGTNGQAILPYPVPAGAALGPVQIRATFVEDATHLGSTNTGTLTIKP